MNQLIQQKAKTTNVGKGQNVPIQPQLQPIQQIVQAQQQQQIEQQPLQNQKHQELEQDQQHQQQLIQQQINQQQQIQQQQEFEQEQHQQTQQQQPQQQQQIIHPRVSNEIIPPFQNIKIPQIYSPDFQIRDEIISKGFMSNIIPIQQQQLLHLQSTNLKDESLDLNEIVKNVEGIKQGISVPEIFEETIKKKNLKDKEETEVNNKKDDNLDKETKMKPIATQQPKKVKENVVPLETYLKDESLDSQSVPEDIKNRITFLLNNLTINNTEEKANEIKVLIDNEVTTRWFASILVIKRAAHDNIMQKNYISLLNKINNKNLFKLVLKETYNCLNKLLLAEKTQEKTNFQTNEKNVLKHLGSWLGQITLARNKPIVLKYLNIKSLLAEAFANGKLDTVLPMICRILPSSKDSVVFKPSNPWMASILGFLSEITQNEIKISLRCEIQVH